MIRATSGGAAEPRLQVRLEFGDGWHETEVDAAGDFRWMGPEAHCVIHGQDSAGPGFLRVKGGLNGAGAATPILTAIANGTSLGSQPVCADLGFHVFPIQLDDRLTLTFTVSESFSPEADQRTLAMMVRSIEVLSARQLSEPLDADGWYDWERHDYFPFRWMKPAARLIVPPQFSARGRFVSLPILSTHETGAQTLTVSSNGRPLADISLSGGWHVYDIELEAEHGRPDGVPFDEISFRVDRPAHRSWLDLDPRDLGVAVGEMEIHDDRPRHERVRQLSDGRANRVLLDEAQKRNRRARDPQAQPDFPASCSIDTGWNGLEMGEAGPFRWMQLEGRLTVPIEKDGPARFCEVRIFSAFDDLSQELTVLAGDDASEPIPLLSGWHTYDLDRPVAAASTELRLRLNKVTTPDSHPRDPRELGIRVGIPVFHSDPARHARRRSAFTNRLANLQEQRDGATVLTSFPRTLGIDLYAKCNISPPCVYCLWDRMKQLEGPNQSAVVDDRTLLSYGPFFESAEALVNCSFGEPLLHPRLDDVVGLAERGEKTLELSSNGQAFSPSSIRALAGRPVHLYVSLDAGTSQTYSRLRNDRWTEVLAGLCAFRDVRRIAGGWPRLNMVFIPMRANRSDLEAYFRLCRIVDADVLVLRPLLALESPDIVRERGGYRFDYSTEGLSVEELETVFAEARQLGEQYDVGIRSQFDFGKQETAENQTRA
jgi:hypothetical protein